MSHRTNKREMDKKNAKSVSSADVHSYIFIPAVAIWPLGQCLFVCLA